MVVVHGGDAWCICFGGFLKMQLLELIGRPKSVSSLKLISQFVSSHYHALKMHSIKKTFDSKYKRYLEQYRFRRRLMIMV